MAAAATSSSATSALRRHPRDIAPWWPLTPGAPLPETPLDVDTVLLADLPVDATAALRRCEPLAVEVRGVPVTDLLDPIYTTLIDGSQNGRDGLHGAGRR